MFKENPLETFLKKKINQRTYEKVKIAKEYIERKYILKTMKDSKYNAILEKLKSKDISDEEKNKILEELRVNSSKTNNS